jgi:hypothetical protein
MRILKRHKFTLNRDVEITANYKKGRCKLSTADHCKQVRGIRVVDLDPNPHPHQSDKLNPDPHKSDKQDLDPHSGSASV